jgi:hypothetical protein
MKFEWDEVKADINFRKHFISFDQATLGWNDPNAFVVIDERHDYGETRFNMTAEIDGYIFRIAFTLRNNAYRIISVRRAN